MENENNYNVPQNDEFGEKSQQPYEQQSYEQQAYGQQPYGQQPYGQFYNGGYAPLDKNGQPLKNRFGMKLTFSILEMLACNPISLVCGIVGCIYTTKANTSYKEGRFEDFKSNAKTATVWLWVGLSGVVLLIIVSVLFMLLVFSMLKQESLYSYDDISGYDSSFYNYEDAPIVKEDEEDEQPVVVIPGVGYSDPSVMLDGQYIELPLTYPMLIASGFYIDSEDEEYYLNKNEYSYAAFYNSDEEYVGMAYIGNIMDAAAPCKDCVVFGLWLDFEDVDVSFGNGINENATKNDLLEAYGEPDYAYESESGDYQCYQWYSHSELYEDLEDNSIEFTYFGGELSEVNIRYIGWE